MKRSEMKNLTIGREIEIVSPIFHEILHSNEFLTFWSDYSWGDGFLVYHDTFIPFRM